MQTVPAFIIMQPQNIAQEEGGSQPGSSHLQMQNQPQLQKYFPKACPMQRAERYESKGIKQSPSQNTPSSC